MPIDLIGGCMFSGKTEEMFGRLNREKIAGRKIQLFKPLLDTSRYSKTEVVSHSGYSFAAEVVSSTKDLISKIHKDTKVIGLDEGPFNDWETIDFILDKLNTYKFIVTTLLLDYRGLPFPFRQIGNLYQDSNRTIIELVPYSTIIEKQAICVFPISLEEQKITLPRGDEGEVCGLLARNTQRFRHDGKLSEFEEPTIVVGGKELYIPVCDRHYIRPIKGGRFLNQLTGEIM